MKQYTADNLVIHPGKTSDPDGMTPQEFDSYGATVRTLRAFIAAAHDLPAVIREFMLPNPDV